LFCFVLLVCCFACFRVFAFFLACSLTTTRCYSGESFNRGG
jgi:hypothetical protein